eukprot:scaffold647869_cov43-Prasinocladus_malaysianus.AAC.1
MQLASAGNDVLAGLLDLALDHGVRLGQALERVHQLGKVRGHLALHGNADDGRHAELHGLDGVRVVVLLVGEGGILLDEGVQADQGHGVAGGDVLDGVLAAAHAQHGALDGLDEQVLLLAWDVVGPHNTDLETGGDPSREHTAKGEKAALVGRRDHLGNIHHEGAVSITVADGIAVLVVEGALVQGVGTVLLGEGRGGEMVDHHLKQGLVGREPALHDGLHQRLTGLLLDVGLNSDPELLAQSKELVLLVVHGGLDDGLDGVVHKLDKAALAALGAGGLLGPLLGLGVEKVVTPELGHHLVLLNLELGGVNLGERGQGEGPAVQPSGEGDGALVRVDLDVTQSLVLVGGHDHVGGLNHTGKRVVGLLAVKHQLDEAAIQLVDSQDRLNTLAQSLAQHGLCLHTHTLHAVHNHQGTVGDTEGSSDLRREVNVTGRIDQVDEVVVALPGTLEVAQLVLGHLIVQRNTSGLDGDTAVLLVLPGVCQAGIASLRDPEAIILSLAKA